jgi:hypothetical protein
MDRTIQDRQDAHALREKVCGIATEEQAEEEREIKSNRLTAVRSGKKGVDHDRYQIVAAFSKAG